MACPQCAVRLPAPSWSRLVVRSPRRAAFHTSSPRQRLGAATYRQEWQTGAYHYNKETTKNHPVAAQTVNRLLEQYVTMQQETKAPPAVLRAAIATRRKSMENFFVSHSTAKDFGDRVVVDAVVYDSASALKKDKEARTAQRRARPAGGADPQGGGQRRSPMRGGGVGGAGAAGGAARFGGGSRGGGGGGLAFRSISRGGVAGPSLSARTGGPRSGGLNGPRPGGLNGPRPGGLNGPRPGGPNGPRPSGLNGPRSGDLSKSSPSGPGALKITRVGYGGLRSGGGSSSAPPRRSTGPSAGS